MHGNDDARRRGSKAHCHPKALDPQLKYFQALMGKAEWKLPLEPVVAAGVDR
jgi:hypothetical protein